MNDNESLRDEIHALLAEMAEWRKGDALRQQQLNLLYASMKDFVLVSQKLNAGLMALQNAVDAIGTRRN